MFASCYDLNTRDTLDGSATIQDDQLGNPDSLTLEGASYVYRRAGHSCNYPMGVDPVWGLASNKLVFSNGVKMKIAVIFGVLHMTMGIVMKGTNTIYFKDYASFFLEVVTALIILLGLFGWMDLLIFAKWFHHIDIDDSTKHPTATYAVKTDSEDPSENERPMSWGDYDNQRAPSVINIMIDLFFNFGTPKNPDMDGYIGSDIKTEFNVGFALLILVIICIPIMLFVKPCCFRKAPAPEDENEIEITNINRGDDEEGLVQE